MSNGNGNRGRKPDKWILLISSIGVSFLLGVFLDVRVLFRPREGVHGHGIPVFSILLPLFAIFVVIIILFVTAVTAVRKMPASCGKHYEYIKSCWKYSHANEPILTFHEVDLDKGRCGVRCIEIYRDGHKECLVNKSTYAPVPTVESINALPDYTAYIITRQEFEDTWNR